MYKKCGFVVESLLPGHYHFYEKLHDAYQLAKPVNTKSTASWSWLGGCLVM
jgi:hypothetical protein